PARACVGPRVPPPARRCAGRLQFRELGRPGRGGPTKEVVPMTAATQAVAPAQLQTRFLSLLPRIEARARVYFRHVRCRDRKEDFAREAVALCWLWFVRLTRRG